MELAGKVAVVTGGGRGLGRAIALKLAREGALVCINYAGNRAAAEETLAQIAAAGGEAFAVQAKLRGEAEAEGLRDGLLAELARRGRPGRLDILVNNIGGGDYGTIRDADEAFYDGMMDNNVRAPFFVTRVLAEAINDHGRVINISSTGARLTDPGIIVYTMAKAAVEAFTRVLAAELGPRGITVNAIGPGFTAGETNAYIVEDPEKAAPVIAATALRRFGQPEEIADIVYAFAGPLGRWVTAQAVEASGGFRL